MRKYSKKAILIFQKVDIQATFNKKKLGNYEERLKYRTGPGENGEGVSLSSTEVSKGEKSVAEYGFNMVASGKISLDRRIKDTRPGE